MDTQIFPPSDRTIASPINIRTDHRHGLTVSTPFLQVIREPFLKRPLDFILAGVGLLFSAPLWAIVAIAFKPEDGGPMFYTQERWGRGEKRFRVRKFRYDLLYIRNQSFWLDLRLIALSFWISLRGQWETRKKKF